ncbi:MAG: TAXI family TRAP transporter solute-binding subunit [Candidatus Tectomicrobia bacterium]|uniref:TAXI family TRAP transporter solute-binding subunit n=1 Tax=Tectimicrobiota bacterium TaxID=2528274 RepID=A0A932I043_UNCTE|nr:TAXI family TRAP transporter solute-binding subunit [Candidatus Tectomicrobia bacterium]
MKRVGIGTVIFSVMLLTAATIAFAAKFEIGLAGAGPASLAYTLAAGVAENTNTKTKLLRITAETSAGFVENIRLVGRGESHLAFTGGIQIFQAFRGLGPYKGESPYKDLRGVAVTHGTNVSWNAREGINSVPELAGKTVSIGPPGSAIADLGLLILDAYEVRSKVKILRLSYEESSRAFVDGQVDAFMGGPAPYPAVMQAGAQKKINILPLDMERLKKIQKLAPVFLDTIPAGAYDWLKKDVPVLGYLGYIVAHKGVPEEAVHELLKVNLSPEGVTYLKRNHRLWNMWNTKTYIEEKGAFALEGLKLHPGAVRYWKEKGVSIPSALLP